MTSSVLVKGGFLRSVLLAILRPKVFVTACWCGLLCGTHHEVRCIKKLGFINFTARERCSSVWADLVSAAGKDQFTAHMKTFHAVYATGNAFLVRHARLRRCLGNLDRQLFLMILSASTKSFPCQAYPAIYQPRQLLVFRHGISAAEIQIAQLTPAAIWVLEYQRGYDHCSIVWTSLTAILPFHFLMLVTERTVKKRGSGKKVHYNHIGTVIREGTMTNFSHVGMVTSVFSLDVS
jgi:hypothetical protein